MKIEIFLILFLVGMIGCTSSKSLAKNQPVMKDANSLKLTEISDDDEYGLSPKKPVKTGGGPTYERYYLNALAGPDGETISYYRNGSCCPTKSKNAMFGNSVMLDEYYVTWEGSSDTISIFINMYDSDEVKAPKGFTIKKK